MRDIDEHFLPGVSFDLDGETIPARELAWAMFASCGCVSGMHLMTEDAASLSAAWKQMSGSERMIKRDKARGFDIRMVKFRDVPFDDCPHSPKWGYTPPPTPPGYSWATTSTARSLHLVPLTELDKEQQKQLGREWAEENPAPSKKVLSICERASDYHFIWTRKWYRLDGKPECTHCVKLAQKQVLL